MRSNPVAFEKQPVAFKKQPVSFEEQPGEMALLDIASVSAQMNNNFNAKILNYRIVDDDGKFAMYTIQLTISSYTWTVERRYSEFDVLDSKRFLDRKKSFLPPKKIVGNTEPDFLKERKCELEKYVRALLELEVWYQKQKKVYSLPLITAKFFDFHQYEVHSIVDDLSVRLGQVGDDWLDASTTQPRYFEFTPIELHAVTERLRLAEPTSPDAKLLGDIGNTVEFLHRVRALKIRGSKGYVGTSNIVWNSLEFSVECCKSLLALWIADSDVTRLHGVFALKSTLRRLVVHYSMKNLQDLLLEEDQLVPLETMPVFEQLEQADLSFNELQSVHESVRLLGTVRHLSLAHNCIDDIGPHLQHLTSLTELDLSNNKIERIDKWNEKLGNVKRLILADNNISHLSGLSKLYSLEYLDLKNNNVKCVEEIHSLSNLPCLRSIVFRGNPVRQVVDYRTKVLEAFGERCKEIKLDGRSPDNREEDTIRVRLALRRAKDEKEQMERRRHRRIQHRIRYLTGEVDTLSEDQQHSV